MLTVRSRPNMEMRQISINKRIDEYNKTSNKELENMKKNQSELKNIITEMKDTLEGMKS